MQTFTIKNHHANFEIKNQQSPNLNYGKPSTYNCWVWKSQQYAYLLAAGDAQDWLKWTSDIINYKLIYWKVTKVVLIEKCVKTRAGWTVDQDHSNLCCRSRRSQATCRMLKCQLISQLSVYTAWIPYCSSSSSCLRQALAQKK